VITVTADFIQTEVVTPVSVYQIAIIAYFHSDVEIRISTDIIFAKVFAVVVIGCISIITLFGNMKMRIRM